MDNQTNIDQWNAKIKDLQSEKATLNPISADDRFRITQIDQQIADLQAQVNGAAEQADLDQIHEVVQELVLGRDFNSVLGHPDANKIIYTLLYEEKQNQLIETRTKNADIQQLKDELAQKDEGLHAASESNDILTDNLAKLTVENETLTDEKSQLLNESRTLRNEVTRLQGQVTDLQGALEVEKKKAQAFIPRSSSTLDEIIADATNTTKQRRQITNVQPVDLKKSAYTATDETGQAITIPWTELGKYEQVDSFPAPPAGNQVDDGSAPVTEDDIAAQAHEVATASAEAERFQDVVSGDAAGQETESGAAEVVGHDDEAAATEAPKASIEARIGALEAWRLHAEELIKLLAFQR